MKISYSFPGPRDCLLNFLSFLDSFLCDLGGIGAQPYQPPLFGIAALLHNWDHITSILKLCLGDKTSSVQGFTLPKTRSNINNAARKRSKGNNPDTAVFAFSVATNMTMLKLGNLNIHPKRTWWVNRNAAEAQILMNLGSKIQAVYK